MEQINPLSKLDLAPIQEYLDDPFTPPACATLEYQWLHFLAESLNQNIPIHPQTIYIGETNISATIITPEPSSIVIRSTLVIASDYPQFEGLALGKSHLLPLRTLYQDARYGINRRRGSWQKELKDILEPLGFLPPNDQTNTLTLLITLLKLNNLPIGPNFKASIINFSHWLKQSGHADSSYGWKLYKEE